MRHPRFCLALALAMIAPSFSSAAPPSEGAGPPLNVLFIINGQELGQGSVYGLLDIPAEHTLTAWTAKEGHTLRPLIEHQDDGSGRVAVSEWHSTHVPAFMLFDGRWKYLCGHSAKAPSLDALYDLQTDPRELNNLIGLNPERDKHRAEAGRMKDRLVVWLASSTPHGG